MSNDIYLVYLHKKIRTPLDVEALRKQLRDMGWTWITILEEPENWAFYTPFNHSGEHQKWLAFILKSLCILQVKGFRFPRSGVTVTDFHQAISGGEGPKLENLWA